MFRLDKGFYSEISTRNKNKDLEICESSNLSIQIEKEIEKEDPSIFQSSILNSSFLCLATACTCTADFAEK